MNPFPTPVIAKILAFALSREQLAAYWFELTRDTPGLKDYFRMFEEQTGMQNTVDKWETSLLDLSKPQPREFFYRASADGSYEKVAIEGESNWGSPKPPLWWNKRRQHLLYNDFVHRIRQFQSILPTCTFTNVMEPDDCYSAAELHGFFHYSLFPLPKNRGELSYPSHPDDESEFHFCSRHNLSMDDLREVTFCQGTQREDYCNTESRVHMELFGASFRATFQCIQWNYDYKEKRAYDFMKPLLEEHGLPPLSWGLFTEDEHTIPLSIVKRRIEFLVQYPDMWNCISSGFYQHAILANRCGWYDKCIRFVRDWDVSNDWHYVVHINLLVHNHDVPTFQFPWEWVLRGMSLKKLHNQVVLLVNKDQKKAMKWAYTLFDPQRFEAINRS